MQLTAVLAPLLRDAGYLLSGVAAGLMCALFASAAIDWLVARRRADTPAPRRMSETAAMTAVAILETQAAAAGTAVVPAPAATPTAGAGDLNRAALRHRAVYDAEHARALERVEALRRRVTVRIARATAVPATDGGVVAPPASSPSPRPTPDP